MPKSCCGELWLTEHRASLGTFSDLCTDYPWNEVFKFGDGVPRQCTARVSSVCATNGVHWINNMCVLPTPIPALGYRELMQILGIIPNVITGTFSAIHLGIRDRPLLLTRAGHVAIPIDEWGHAALPDISTWSRHVQRDADLSPWLS